MTITMVTALVIMMVVVFGAPLVLFLLARSESAAGARVRAALGISESQLRATPSFSRWWSADRDREQAARDIARTHAMRYVGDSRDELDRLRRFSIFFNKTGRVEELIVGETTAVRESLSSYYYLRRYFTLAYFISDDLKLPRFRLSVRDFPIRDSTSPVISFSDVPDFSARYEVRGGDERQIGAFLDRSVRTSLVKHVGLWIEGNGSELLCASAFDYTQLSEREDFLRAGRALCSLLTSRSTAVGG